MGFYWVLLQGRDWLPIAAIPFLIAVAVWSSGEYEKIVGHRDPVEIVVDEVAGQVLCLLGTPISSAGFFAGFLVFRFFDIWKPFRRVEDLPGGFGVVADDILAGICGWVILALGRWTGFL